MNPTFAQRSFLRKSSYLLAGGGLLAASPLSAVVVTNPGFEANSIGGNGYGAISGWTNNVAASGVNTAAQPFLEQPAHSGSQVAFIQQGAGGVPLSQALTGFDPTKTYSVTYFVSERGMTGASTTTSVSLDGGLTSFSYPGAIVKTDKFRRVVSGPLAVSGVTSTLQLSAANGPGDDSLLIDSVTVGRAVPVVTGGGFETPVQPNTDANTRYELANGAGGGSLTGAGWTFQGTTGISRNLSAYQPLAGSNAPEGSQSALLIGQNQCSTTVAGFEAGVSYSLSFEALGRAGTFGPNGIEVLLDGNPLEFLAATSITPSQAAWGTFTTDAFTTSGGSFALTFLGLTPGDKATFIDDVRFNFVAEAVPEPGAALLGGLGTLLLLRRRR
jgi:hypothetical protein